MKHVWLPGLLFLLVTSCDDAGSSGTTSTATSTDDSPASTHQQQGGIVGEWEQVHTVIDKNGNNELDAEEKENPSSAKIGDYYLRFYPDGKCEYSNARMEGTYEVTTNNGSQVVHIKAGDGRELKILSMDREEMVLMPTKAPGTFLVYQRL